VEFAGSSFMGDFAALVDAPVFIGVRSTFSLWAGLMNRNGRIYLPQCELYLENEAPPVAGVHWIQDDEWSDFVDSTTADRITTEALMARLEV
jgi:hypothetical protein